MTDVTRLFRHRRLHPSIETQVMPHLRATAWDEAVNTAFICLETRLRVATGSKDGYGTRLIDTALKPGSGVLVDHSTPVPEQEGFHQLALGAYRTYRNRGAHHFVGLSPDEAADIVLLIDRLIRRVDSLELKRQGRSVPYSDIPVSASKSTILEEFLCDVDQDGRDEIVTGDPCPDVAIRVFRDDEDGRIPVAVRQPWRALGFMLVNAFVRDLTGAGLYVMACDFAGPVQGFAMLLYRWDAQAGEVAPLLAHDADYPDATTGAPWFFDAVLADFDRDG